MEHWHLLLEREPRTAADNMAVDQHLLDLIEQGTILKPVLRIYSWSRPTLSLGYHQQWRRVVNLDGIREHGVDLVRRWTGGRAVLHDTGEITYALIAPQQPPFSKKVSHNYHLIGQALQRFTNLGKQNSLLAQGSSTEAEKRMRHTPCFASLSPSEIEDQGKKLIGSAQKLGKSGFLQHGSIPLIHRAEVLTAVTGTNIDMSRYMTSLEDYFAGAGLPIPDHEILIARLVTAFQDQFAIRFSPLDRLGYPAEKAVRRIAAKQFGLDSWTFRK